MKYINKILLFLFLLGVALLNNTCSDERYLVTVTYEGYVYDSLGGKPVQGIWVSLVACQEGDGRGQCDNYVVGQAQTDISGRFTIHNNAARSNRYSPMVNGIILGDLQNSRTNLSTECKYIYLNQIP